MDVEAEFGVQNPTERRDLDRQGETHGGGGQGEHGVEAVAQALLKRMHTME
jgi:hypothetical protein